MTLQT